MGGYQSRCSKLSGQNWLNQSLPVVLLRYGAAVIELIGIPKQGELYANRHKKTGASPVFSCYLGWPMENAV